MTDSSPYTPPAVWVWSKGNGGKFAHINPSLEPHSPCDPLNRGLPDGRLPCQPSKPEVVEEARNACRELRLIGKSRRRERRPTTQELAKLDEHFARRDRRSRIPMRDIMWFAIHSARRESEICRLEWADNQQRGRTGLVRDAKHPRHKEGNHRRFKLTAEAWEIIERQPKTSEYVFPYDPRGVSAAFTRACRVLGFEDLRFHELRHEATSRLFERGYQIHEEAQFTLHESWERAEEIHQPSP